MKVDIETVDQVTRKLTVEIPPEVVAEEIAVAYKDLSRTARIKGFRPGKVPRDILVKYYADAVKEDVLTRVVEHSYREALTRSKVSPVSHPRIEGVTMEEGKGIRYSATVEVRPEVSLAQYTGLTVTRRRYTVTEEDAVRAEDDLRERFAVVEPTSLVRPLQKGDIAVVDIQQLKSGSARQGDKTPVNPADILDAKENVMVEVGTGATPIDSALLGMEAGQERDVMVGDSALATSGARYHVKVKEVRVKVLPPLDDELSKSAGYTTVQELKTAIRTHLDEDAARRSEREFRDALLDALIDKNPVDAPSSMVDAQLEYMYHEMKRLLGPRAGDVEEKRFKEELRPRAVKQVRASLLLDAVAVKENISVTDEDVEKELTKIAAQRKERVEAVRERYKKQGLLDAVRAEIREEKAMSSVASRAQVTEV